MKITVPNIRQIQYEICWAACIEMVARYIIKPSSNKLITKTLAGNRYPVPLQYEILEEFLPLYTGMDTSSDHATISNNELLMLQNFCSHVGGFPRMYYNIKGYEYILKNRFGIKCIQVIGTNFPSYTFLTSIIDKKQPIILGIKYPGFDNNHAVVITGYFKKNSQRMLVLNDPLTNNGNEPICQQKKGNEKFMNYDALNFLNRQTHSLQTIAPNLLNLVYNFSETTEIPSNEPQFEISIPEIYENPEDIVGIVKELLASNLIFEHQPVTLKFSTSMIRYIMTPINLFVEEPDAASSNILIPIYDEDEQVYDIILKRIRSGIMSVITSYYLIGVQESYFSTLKGLQKVLIKDNEGQTAIIEVDQTNPNYFILQILPINLCLMVFEGENTKCYVSLSDIPYSGIKYLHPYLLEELTEILVSSYPSFLN